MIEPKFVVWSLGGHKFGKVLDHVLPDARQVGVPIEHRLPKRTRKDVSVHLFCFVAMKRAHVICVWCF